MRIALSIISGVNRENSYFCFDLDNKGTHEIRASFPIENGTPIRNKYREHASLTLYKKKIRRNK
jgi:hypothetical protein